MGNIMAPSTEAVMGALPTAKAGVGSAMNDLVRQVAGALGVAIIGSVVNTVYSSRMDDVVASLPPEAADPAGDSVGAALRIATDVGGPQGAALARSASDAFIDSFGVAALIASGVVLLGGFLVRRYLPAEGVEHQHVEAEAASYAPAATRAGHQHGD
jgi:hypothetical protein